MHLTEWWPRDGCSDSLQDDNDDDDDGAGGIERANEFNLHLRFFSKLSQLTEGREEEQDRRSSEASKTRNICGRESSHSANTGFGCCHAHRSARVLLTKMLDGLGVLQTRLQPRESMSEWLNEGKRNSFSPSEREFHSLDRDLFRLRCLDWLRLDLRERESQNTVLEARLHLLRVEVLQRDSE